MRMIAGTIIALFCFLPEAFAGENVVNVYMWSGIIPEAIIQKFEKDTGIKVNFSTYDSNEVMYAKLRAGKNPGYDIVEPSSYYIERMHHQDMLEKIDKSKLSNFRNLNPEFLNKPYDPSNHYSIPFVWGITGIFINKEYFTPNTINGWSDLWDKKYADKLMLLDDSREVFAIALRVLGYSINTNKPEEIRQAYLKLKELSPNIKIFNSSVLSILIDEDATIGMAWNGDLFKSKKENHQLDFIYPKDGFAIWVDSFAIPKNAPHRDNAYKFINYMLRADIDKSITLDNDFPTTNSAAQKLLPNEIKNNPTVYPSHETLRRGEFEEDIGDKALALYEKYWERLKMGG
jgi:spermidine/putrescine transport system substrate-binding protein